MINGGRQFSSPKEMDKSFNPPKRIDRIFIGQRGKGAEIKEKAVNLYETALNPFRKENKNGS